MRDGILTSISVFLFAFSTSVVADELSIATFAGGCFWCMQPPFDALKGVSKTQAGYTGGEVSHPTYVQVSSGNTGHREAIQVFYDPKKITYEKLLDVFWHNIDPTDNKGQFCDKGNQYRSAIFYHDAEQKKIAERSKEKLLLERTVSSIATEILPAKTFYSAEDEHQKYYKTHPYKYKFYRYTCGRDERLKQIWGKSLEYAE